MFEGGRKSLFEVERKAGNEEVEEAARTCEVGRAVGSWLVGTVGWPVVGWMVRTVGWLVVGWLVQTALSVCCSSILVLGRGRVVTCLMLQVPKVREGASVGRRTWQLEDLASSRLSVGGTFLERGLQKNKWG